MVYTMGNVIDAKIVGETLNDHAARKVVWWRSLPRRIRRTFHGLWMRLSPSTRNAISFAAVFVGWFLAWMLFYIAVIISFAYSFLAGLTVVFIFGVIFYKFLEKWL
jgi:hypothetical protein